MRAKIKILKTYRTQLKAYGISFLITVTGNAGEFNEVPTLGNDRNLSLATVLADLALLNVATKRKFYKELKVLD